jgi:hypothetical protein
VLGSTDSALYRVPRAKKWPEVCRTLRTKRSRLCYPPCLLCKRRGILYFAEELSLAITYPLWEIRPRERWEAPYLG